MEGYPGLLDGSIQGALSYCNLVPEVVDLLLDLKLNVHMAAGLIEIQLVNEFESFKLRQ